MSASKKPEQKMEAFCERGIRSVKSNVGKLFRCKRENDLKKTEYCCIDSSRG
jgi:hypothetical protein